MSLLWELPRHPKPSEIYLHNSIRLRKHIVLSYQLTAIKDTQFLKLWTLQISNSYLIRKIFKGYSCETDIVILAWMITWILNVFFYKIGISINYTGCPKNRNSQICFTEDFNVFRLLKGFTTMWEGSNNLKKVILSENIKSFCKTNLLTIATLETWKILNVVFHSFFIRWYQRE